MQEICEQWARRHGARFEPTKYELIHLTKIPKKFNMEKPVRISAANVPPKGHIRILGVQVDSTLSWRPQIASVIAKTTHQMGALTSLAASTWGAGVTWARRLYLTMVRPVLTYASAIWAPAATDKRRKGQMAALERCQTQAPRRVAGAYRAVHHQILKKELAIPALEAYYNQLLLGAEKRWEKKAWCDYTEATVQQAHTGSTRDVGESTSLNLRRRWAKRTLVSYTPLEYSTQQAKGEWKEYQRKTVNRAPAYEGE